MESFYMNKLMLCGILIMSSGTLNAFPEYISENDNLQLTCPAINLDQTDEIVKEIKNLNPIIRDAYLPKLDFVLKNLKNTSADNDEILTKMSGELCSISNVLPYEMMKQLMNCCLNLLIRLASKGNIDAMYDLISTSYVPDKNDVRNIVNIKGIEDLDFEQLIEKLASELEEDGSEDSFINVIKNMPQKSNSAPNSPVSFHGKTQKRETQSDSELYDKKDGVCQL